VRENLKTGQYLPYLPCGGGIAVLTTSENDHEQRIHCRFKSSAFNPDATFSAIKPASALLGLAP
jgi:hypothetical protein